MFSLLAFRCIGCGLWFIILVSNGVGTRSYVEYSELYLGSSLSQWNIYFKKNNKSFFKLSILPQALSLYASSTFILVLHFLMSLCAFSLSSLPCFFHSPAAVPRRAPTPSGAVMWQEARKHERKLRGMMVDYKRRGERRREYYEKIVRELYHLYTWATYGETLEYYFCYRGALWPEILVYLILHFQRVSFLFKNENWRIAECGTAPVLNSGIVLF